MSNIGCPWKNDELKSLLDAYKQKEPWISDSQFAIHWGKPRGRSIESVRSQLGRLRREFKLQETPVPYSEYPVYDQPLEMEGDAVCIGDVEAPYQHADFLSKVFDLANKWKIDQINIVGDFLHFDCLSSFSKNWQRTKSGGITSSAATLLEEEARSWRDKERQQLQEMIDKIGIRNEEDGLSEELRHARSLVRRINDQFKVVHMALGNHEGRVLRKMDVRMEAKEISQWIEAPSWKIAPYYYAILISNGQKYYLEHPTDFAKGASKGLCARYHSNVIMFHNHHYYKSLDVSGQYLALEPGCCVDENRLAYASQRHSRKDAHVLGAVIVRGGVAWDLGLEPQRTDWKSLARL